MVQDGGVRLVPDLGSELVVVLEQLEELLHQLAVHEVDAVRPLVLPEPLAGGLALDAMVALSDAVASTQSRVGALGHRHEVRPGPGSGRLLGPDGSVEHRPLRLLALEQPRLDLLGDAARVLGRHVVAEPLGDLAGRIAATARTTTGTNGPRVTAVGLIETFICVHGLLDLPASDDSAALAEHIASCGIGADVVLTDELEAAYLREAARMNTVLRFGAAFVDVVVD